MILTGENLQDAQPGRDSQTQESTVNLTLDSKGARIFRDVTRDNIGKRMAIVLFENGKGEVVTAPVIRSEIPGGHVQISGNTARSPPPPLPPRAGASRRRHAIEERTHRPEPGRRQHPAGVRFHAVWLHGHRDLRGLLYYHLFGVFSTLGLSFNVLLVAILSMLQATLTLPGIAAMALTLGMAIDANVLINKQIREELERGTRRNRRSTWDSSGPGRRFSIPT
ncbi:Protein translocase subunit SecD OS=Castellaniella defragrans OX=75697 GN=secD PE=3 SV=1 [Castellaniella defragrans]